MSEIILDLCGGSGAWSHPYEKAGYDVRRVTLPEQDVCTFTPPRGVVGILAAPPCTQFSFVLNEKVARDFDGGMKIVNACLRIVDQVKARGELRWWALENPVGHLAKFLGAPRYTFQPWWFGDPWTKRTALWGEFASPAQTHTSWESVPKNDQLYIRPRRGKPNMVWLHKAAMHHIPRYKPFIPYVKTDADFRSLTPQGFAQAFYKSNR